MARFMSFVAHCSADKRVFFWGGLVAVCLQLSGAVAMVDGIEWTYTVSNGEVSLGGGSPSTRTVSISTTGAITIPSVLQGYPVVSVGNSAFYGCSKIVSVTIPDSVKSIGKSAFENCRGLLDITIPNSVTNIETRAFMNCSGLTNVTIGNGVATIKDEAFLKCINLDSVILADSVTTIGEGAFRECGGLSGVTLPNSVTNIKSSAFAYCTSLKDVTLPDSVANIGSAAFFGCTGLTSVVISCSVLNIDYKVFSGCSGLKDVVIPDSVIGVGSYAFAGCSGLTSVTIPDSVTSIGNDSFSGCSGLKDVIIPDSVISVGNYAFAGCSGLTSVTIPDSVTSIGSSAFDGCSGLTSVTIPNSVTNIGSGAFGGCSGLTNVRVPQAGVDAFRNKFSGYDDLTVFISDGVTNIEDKAFYECYHLTSLTIPSTVTHIGAEAFWHCYGLKSVHIADIAKWCDISFGDSWSNPFCYAENLYLGSEIITELTIPDGTVNIGDLAFYECNWLTSVTMPNSVTNIGRYAFYYCKGLASVTIPDSVTSIGSAAFGGCSGLTSITIPSSVKSMGNSAFCYCRELTSVTFADGMTDIGDSLFYGCGDLTSVTIPNSVTNIGANAFKYCSNINSLTLPQVVGLSCALSDVFGDSTNKITHVGFSLGVTNITGRMFRDCNALTSVTMPDSVAYIDDYAFEGCNRLTSVTMKGDCPKVGPSAFVGVPLSCVVRLPVGNDTYILSNGKWQGMVVGYGYTVTFDANGGSGGWSQMLEYGTDIVEPVVTRDGYTFGGWMPSVVSTVPEDDVRYVAQWIPNKYVVIFDANGGEGGWSRTLDCGSALKAPIVTRTGHTFREWRPSYPMTVQASNATYIAQWSINQYTISFDSAGGTSVLPLTQDYATAVTPPANPTKDGFTFSGWLPSVPVSMPASNMTCTAQWKINQYTVTFDSAGGTTVSAITQDYATAITPPENPAKTGYTFIGWSPSVPATMPANDTTCVARWKINQYTISFDSDCGMSVSPVTQDYATAITPPGNPTKTGYTFMGWSPSVPTTMPAANMTCTAQWKINRYTVSFDSSGGTAVSPITQDYATVITPPEIPTREGYTFMGWTPSVPSTMPAANTTCVAQWKINQYTISFDSAGGTLVSPVKQDYGTAITKPADPTRAGYTFIGWSPSVPATMPATSMTCTAQWQANKYTVTFDANGGTVLPASKIVTFDDVYGVLPIPSLDYCTFVGWRLGNKTVAEIEKVATASDHTLAAQWSRYGAEFTASQVAGKKLRELYPDDYANLTTIVLEEGIAELPERFFDGCDNVEFVAWPSTLLEFGIDDLPSKIRTTLAYDENGFMIYNGWILDYQNRNAAAVTIPDGVVGIGRGAFAAMFDLETVTVPESLKCIAKGAFEDCSWIQDLQFMSGLRYVGPFAFRGCSSLLRATFADGVENLGTNVFESCWRMQSVRLPFTVTNIGVNAFSGCSAIRGVTVPTQVETMQTLFPVAYTKIETAEVAEGETAVMNDMFKGCTALRGGATQTDMSMIPNTVTNIGARAFQGCTSLTAFVVPDSVTEIGEAVFLGCTSLWNVTLSRNLEAIPDKAFYGCTMLETMVVPQKVNYLGNQFFCGKENGANALYYLCTNAPACHASAYSAITGNMTTYVEQGSRSWDGRQGSRVLPQSWNGYPITYWTPNRFDVTFDANGGRFELVDGSAYAWSEQQITDTGYALPSAEPIRPGWAFEGWWTEQYGGAEVRYTTHVTATRTHTLYAHWRLLGEGMTVTFNSNGGTVVVPGSQDYVPGQTFGQFPVPTRRGYAFQGWWTEVVAGVHMTEATQVPAADMELFAHWSPITYVVRFHANGGKGGDVDQTFEFDVQKALASHTFTRTGFAFSGWATTPSGQVRYAENASVVNLEEVQDKVVDLYAVWSGVGYSVRFDSNGGNGIMDNQTIAVGETQNLWPNVFARGGYNFAGWALSPTDAANGTVQYRDGAAVRNLATSNGAVVPLYAVWLSSDQTVRISFDANGGSVSPDYWDCLMGTAVEAFPTATRPGFTFSGWWTAKTGGMEVESIAVVSDARTFYAHWAENGEVNPGDWSCTVSFNANGGSVTETSRIVGSGATVGMLPAPIRMGYSFRGWFTAAEEGVEVTAATVVTGSVTYYAHWAINRYTVTFNANGGEGEMLDQMMIYGELAPLEAVAFAKSGSRFIGWAVEPEGGVVYHDGQSVQDLSADADGVVVLYAVWEECELTLADVLCDDARGVGFSVDSETDWAIDFTDGHDAPSARSGEIAAAENGGRTSTTLTAAVTGEGTGSFWWKVCCEDMDDEYGEWYDYAMFKVDGIAVAQIAGERDWEQVEFVVSGAGTHTLSWTFTRDDYDEDGATYENAAWVDSVIWTPRPVTVTFAAGGAEEGEAPETIVKYQGYELALPGAGTLVNGTCRFVGWTDGVATCEAGSTYIVPATNVTLTAVWELKAWTLGEAVDAAALSFVTGGNADWSVSASNGSTNGVAAKSGTVENGEASWIETTIHGGGTLAFHWNVMGGIYRNTPFAYAKVEVDGVQQAQEFNTEGWKEQTVEIDGAGAHTVRWTYLRTSARMVDVGDCAWLDEVVWMPSGGTIPELTPAQASAWVSEDLAARYAKSGESAVDYQSRFEAKFGADPVAAMAMPTNKKDAHGNDMYVWQDYVAGTDPTDTNSVFTATITMVDGAPVVEWSPKLSAAEEARRSYTVYGKTNLTDKAWHSPTNESSRFFKVGVELR